MKFEFGLNKCEGDWWFDLGISYQHTQYYPGMKRVFAIALGLATIYIRW